MSNSPFYVKGAAIMLCLVIITAGLYYGQALFMPLCTALLLACLVLPAVRNLEALRLSRWTAALISVLVVFGVTGAIFAFLWVQLGVFYQNIDTMGTILGKQVAGLQHFAGGTLGLPAARSEEWIELQRLRLIDWLTEFVLSLMGGRENALTRILLIPFFMFFALTYRQRMKVVLMAAHPAHAALPASDAPRPLALVDKLTALAQRYVRGVLTVAIIIWVCATSAFYLIGLKYAVLAGLVVALLNIIPYVGFIFGSLFPMLIAIIQQGEPSLAVAAFAICLFLHLLDANLLSPYVLGPCISLNPLVTMLALLAGGLLWGMAGMILAVLFAGMLKLVLDNVPGLRPFGYLMGEELEYGAGLPAKTTLLLPGE